MKVYIEKPGVYELTLVEEVKPQPPVIVPEPPTEPEPPTITDPKPDDQFLQRLASVLTNNKEWSQPEVVWEFEGSAGGAFIPLSDKENLQQNREGGSIRWHKSSGRTKPKVYGLNGNRTTAFISDAKYFEDKLYAVFKVDEEIYIGRLEESDSSFYLFKHVDFEGAKDTHHSIEVLSHTDFNILGRLRNVDWDTSNPILKDRRGVRLVEVRGNKVTSTVLYDPAKEQPDYAKSKMRYDYYAAKVLKVKGVNIYQISCFSKNEDRQPSTRPDRITGTGPIYPIFALDDYILSHTKTNVNLPFHARRSEWKEAWPFEPEVGQVYGYGMTYENGILSCYYSHRFDTHYLVNKDTASRLPSCKIYKIQVKL